MAVPPLPSPAATRTDKVALRATLRADRRAYVEALAQVDGVADALRTVAESVARHVPAGAIVALYHPFGHELDPRPLGEMLATRGHQLALPHVAADRTSMRFLAWSPRHELFAGAYGLSQPREDGEEIAPTIILTPLVGFDREGGRLGQGAGYYDRAFAALPGAVRVGLAWSVQEVATVPLDPWDVPLHAVATEREWIATARPTR